MKYLRKYNEVRDEDIASIDITEIKDIFQEFIDKYHMVEKPKEYPWCDLPDSIYYKIVKHKNSSIILIEIWSDSDGELSKGTE